MTLIIDLEQIQKLAAERQDEFDVLRYRLQYDDDLTDEQIDTWVESIAQPIVAAINCKLCANCCRSLTIQLGDDDIDLLAQGTDQTSAAIREKYVETETYSDDPDIVGTFKQSPCAFLNGKLCSIYAHRPEACRMYPQFTPDFRWMLNWMVAGSDKCPIIYNVLDSVSQQIDSWQRNT